ncbi:alpha-N-acetylgalactosaminidase [Danaus plexippus]|uniref:alpha-N-acetylgalactosaminidase n=1 Tax=Danaus plexippus TaxID=13037 RepID=UPI002AB2C768|nr:alpha-N-acetylgalactosaminidase [Danaus plexippus]XP_032520191.2 alpha-N-acetylgalactosaminidase [Danaus plexippus]
MGTHLIAIFAIMPYVLALDNGLALTPPMGWLTWQRFRCITDCDKYPNECISESLIKRMADIMVNEGYSHAGYKYVGIDDCWLEKTRDANGRLVPDRKRFPNGMKAVADYLHDLGLKFALYQDYGTKTCAGYPGVLGHEAVDVQTFAEWEVDYIKLDGCNVNVSKMDTGYPEFGKLMNESGRPMVYSCSWPAYQNKPDYASISKHCNMWRNWDDIQDSWASLTTIMSWFAEKQEEIAKYAGPGRWNDPDMLLIGNFGLSLDQARVQMAVWSILAAPLLMSVDLATIRPEFKEVLLNKDIIAIDQDELGKQGLMVWNKAKCEIWTRELVDGIAVAFVSKRDDGAPHTVDVTTEDMKIPPTTYHIQDLYKDGHNFKFDCKGNFTTRINPSGVRFYKFIPIKGNEVDSPSITYI